MIEKITYYSEPDIIYDSNVDVVKGASLLGTEVDKNFNTLEGRGIKSVEITKDNYLVITLFNGKKYTCKSPYEGCVNEIDFDYDKDFGVLSVYVNKSDTPIEIDGFLTRGDVKEITEGYSVFSNSTLSGDGTPTSPLSIAKQQRTGLFKPVIDAVEDLPCEGVSVGDRYVTTESVDVYGALYNFKGVQNIIEGISDTKWRVAKKWDWDDMLNALESDFDFKSHHRKDCNVYLGHDANEHLAQEVYGFNPVLCGYANEEEVLHVTYNGLRAAWWTASNEDGKNAYYKRIDKDIDGVYQDIVDGANFYSVRLVRDYEDNEILSAEEIMGTTYPVTLMPSVSRGLRVWISVNFSSDLIPLTEDKTTTKKTVTTDPDNNGCQKIVLTTTTEKIVVDDMKDAIYRPSEYPEAVAVSYINEWDGTKWLKMAVEEYDTFYVINKGDYCRLEGGEVVPVHRNDDELSVQRNMIEALMKLHENDITGAMVNVASGKSDYEFRYEPTIDGNTVSYSDIPLSEVNKGYLMNDFARMLGSMYSTYKLDPVVYSDKTYTWDESLGLKGSNYVRHDEDGGILWIDGYDNKAHTLIHDAVEDFKNAGAQAATIELTIGGRNLCVSITVDTTK